jgi:(p)ppGpp synthase/HD superfamily hydrolase
MNLIEQAQNLAHEAHDSINQKRKYNGRPYWVHTDEVASIVQRTPGATESMVIAAHLHDVLEDVFPVNPKYSAGLIKDMFGFQAVTLVIMLTDMYTKQAYPKLNRAQRHAKENERLGAIFPNAKTVKLADLISNTKSIVAEDPDFARVYLREKLALLPYLADGSPVLLQEASQQTLEGMKTLGIDMPVYSTKV